MSDRLYFKQLLSGRDFARDDPVARQMVTFVYLIGDREKGEARAVDPAYGVDELIDDPAGCPLPRGAHDGAGRFPEALSGAEADQRP